MASLRDRVESTLVRRGGQLVREAPTPTSQLAGEAGLVAPPTTPAGVGALGATPQQQAMAGTPAQKQSALRQSLDTVTTLGEAQADKRYRSVLSTEEAAQAGKQQRLGEVFGGTQQKVADYLAAEIEKQTTTAPGATYQTAGVLKPGAVAPTTGWLIGAGSDAQALIDDAFRLLVTLSDPKKQQVQLEKLISYTGLNEDQIKQAAADAAATQGSAETIGKAAAAATTSEGVNVSALLPSLGTTREELASLLGVDPTVIDTMSLGALNEMVGAVAAQGAAPSVAETAEATQSTLLGGAERAAMREAAIEQSTTGFAASEAELAALSKELESAEVIEFGGREYTVEQLLSDDTISKLISDYLTAPESESSKALAKDPAAAALIEFANRYRSTLTEAAKGVGAVAEKHKQIAETNKQLAVIAPGIEIPDNVMKQVYGSSYGLSNTQEREPKGLVKALKGMSSEDVQKYSTDILQMFALATTDAKVAKSISSFDAARLLQFITPDGKGGTPLSRLSDIPKQKEALESAKGNVNALVDLYFGAGASANITQLVSDSYASKKLGLGVDPVLATLDANMDGKVDPNAGTSLYKALLDAYKSADSVGEVLAGASGFSMVSKPAALDPEMQAVYNTLGGANTINKNGLALSISNTLSGINMSAPYGGEGISGPGVNYLTSLTKLPIYGKNPGLAAKIDDALDKQTFRMLRDSGQPIPGELSDRVNARQMGISVDEARKLREAAQGAPDPMLTMFTPESLRA